MSKSSPSPQTKQSANEGNKQSADTAKPKAGKDAASHTKSTTGKGAGGGAKQARKH